MTLNPFRINYRFVTYSGKISGHPGERGTFYPNACVTSCSPQDEIPYRNTGFPLIILKKIIFTTAFLVLTRRVGFDKKKLSLYYNINDYLAVKMGWLVRKDL
jgi:hypothetical protein